MSSSFVESLERRVFLASQPADVLTKALRQNLLDHWNGANKATLQTKLNENKMGAFDDLLLSYMQTRTSEPFYWDTSEVAANISFIEANMNTAPTIANADDIVAHRFPEQGNSASYDVQLGAGDINWATPPAGETNPEFIPNLNRQDFWLDLAQAYRFTGDSKYINELVSELSSWSKQAASAPGWSALDTGIRAESWCWTYQMVLGSSGWSSGANTLFLEKLAEHGDLLRSATPYALSSNRALFHAKGLLQLSELVPEFTASSSWQTYARTMLFGAMDNQIYPDGGHVEQSPGYAANVIDDLLEAYWLDQKNGHATDWSAARGTQLHNAVESYIQLLSPNGALSALSDTYRTTALTILTKAGIILNTTSWPTAKPRMRDVWLFGSDKAGDYIADPVNPSLGNRGATYGMDDSGYYVMRSGSDSNARQFIFDAGPTGGIHGHFDLLNFELFGYGKPLISDPGLYKYDTSANRAYVISTKAHNTINIDGSNHSAIEKAHNSNIVVDQWTEDVDHAQVSAHHLGYANLAGSPVVGRSIWYDYDDTALIVDWGQADASHQYQISFNLPGSTATGVQPDGSFKSTNGSGNVKVSPLLQAGQTAARNPLTFVSNDAPPNESDPAYRFTVTGSGTSQVFATLITSYSGTSAPNITAEFLTANPQPGQTVTIRLTKNGVPQDIAFTLPAISRPPSNLASSSGSANDMAYDAAGKLHMAFFDRATRNLKYTVRDASGKWSIIQTIDPGLDAGVYVSLALDSVGNPGVAYFDGNNGDLKYAKYSNNAWDIQTVDSTGSVGLYPSLIFSRSNGPIITYYHRTKGDLRMATAASVGFTITSIDTGGDVGRFSSAQLDPNRPDASKVAVAYEDTSTGHYKYAIQYKTGWSIQQVDSTTTNGGGYMSLQFQPYKSADGTYHPTASYYDSGNSALKFASSDGATWVNSTVISDGKVGLYTNLAYDVGNRPNIFFFNKSVNKGYRAILSKGKWTFVLLGVGGREISVARKASGAMAYSTLDDSAPLLEVGFLSS